MTSRSELLQSSVRLLYQNQKRVTEAFRDWTANENVQSHESVRPVIGSVLRHLQRDLDRMYVLVQSYSSAAAPKRTVSGSGAKRNGTTNEADPFFTVEGGIEPSVPNLAEVLSQGYQALEELSTRYASVYSLATALTEPPIANVARANLAGLRSHLSTLIGVWPLVMARSVDVSLGTAARPPPPLEAGPAS
ncbi:hypothetical protein BSZ35_12225 [Salinibacter sp. 10B]|uniref:hypothetical protein n=1 Tax=Salinibacter sp. 10B TaxID=1923971 RepID=UPI000CF532C7|nr:hypothetical protein [Salinibacter sp. 10B]PQJ35262.1 hypothetical protein BSZ35_12225 [Salinibacter sp. 10B]